MLNGSNKFKPLKIDDMVTEIVYQVFKNDFSNHRLDNKNILTTKIQNCTHYLYKLPRQELIDLYNVAKKEERLLAALIAWNDDKLRFFSQPEAEADFTHYLNLNYWTKEEAVALSLGKNPKIVNSKNLADYIATADEEDHAHNSIFIIEFHELLEKLQRAQDIKDTDMPSKFLKWFNKHRLPVFWKLQNIATSIGIIKIEEYAWTRDFGSPSVASEVDNGDDNNPTSMVEQIPLVDKKKTWYKTALIEYINNRSLNKKKLSSAARERLIKEQPVLIQNRSGEFYSSYTVERSFSFSKLKSEASRIKKSAT